jgi:phosphoglycolate phosphatase-like HAD superfamily hydrolase
LRGGTPRPVPQKPITEFQAPQDGLRQAPPVNIGFGLMDLLIFDLDGTLIDSRLDLAQSVNAMLAHMGMAALANERVYSYVGNGAPALVRRALAERAAEPEAQEALEFFLEYYREHALDNTTLDRKSVV